MSEAYALLHSNGDDVAVSDVYESEERARKIMYVTADENNADYQEGDDEVSLTDDHEMWIQSTHYHENLIDKTD